MTDADAKPRFLEVQSPRQWWILLVVAVLAAVAWYAWIEQAILGHPFGQHPAPDAVIWLVFLLTGLLLPIFLLFARLVVAVDDTAVRLRWIPFAKKTLAHDEIRSARAVTYRPVRDYLGWGLKWMPGRGMAWNVSGNRGVMLELESGKKLLIGSERPEELAAAIGKEPEVRGE